MAELAAGVLHAGRTTIVDEPGDAHLLLRRRLGRRRGRPAAAAGRARPGRRPRCCCAPARRSATPSAGATGRRGPRVRARRRWSIGSVRALVRRRVPRARARARAAALLHALRDADDEGYVAVCGALAEFDVRDRLGEIAAPVLAVAGAEDVATPTASARRDRRRASRTGGCVVLDGVAHLAPAEAPDGGGPRCIARARAGADPRADDRTVARGPRRRDGRAPRGARRRPRRPGDRGHHRLHRATSRS